MSGSRPSERSEGGAGPRPEAVSDAETPETPETPTGAMRGTDVTVDGQVNIIPGRLARIGSLTTAQRFGTGGKRKGRRREGSGGGRGEQLMVPPAKPVSYYGKPVLNRPVWQARDIAGYLFAGGLAGSSSVIGAAAALTGRPALARGSKVTALGAIGASTYLLIHDLGRPERFYNMLRVFKPTSPMSVGTWILSVYGPAAGAAAATELTGWFRRSGWVATAGAAVAGPAVAAYTAVLFADTAVPAWHEVYKELPFVFVSSATLAGAGAGLIAAPVAETAPLRRAIVVAAVAELAASHRMESHGLVSEPYAEGRAGKLLKISRALTVGGAALAVAGGRNRLLSAVAGAALLAGSACTRFGVFQAGLQSADDPKYVLQPQRERLDARTGVDQGPDAESAQRQDAREESPARDA